MPLSLYPFRLFITRKTTVWFGIGALVLNIATWVYLLWQFPPTSDIVFLHYNVLFGVDLVGPWWKLLRIPLFGTVVLVLHTVLAWISYQYDAFISHVLFCLAGLMQLLIFLATYMIVYLNI